MSKSIPYFEQLKDPRWQKKRLEILKRDCFGCRHCHNEKHTLNVHHISYIKNKYIWDYPDELYITLCDKCHEKTHKARARINKLLDNVVNQNYITLESIEDLIIHYKKALEHQIGVEFIEMIEKSYK